MKSNLAEISSYTKSDGIRDLSQQIKLGDKKAFEEFFFLMQPGIFKFLIRMIADYETAKDLTQETFIKYWLHRKEINSDLYPKSYLYKIARNLALNHIERDHSVDNSKLKIQKKVNFLLNIEEEYDQHFLMDDFQNAVNQLPERCRATFILSKFEGFEYSEISEILDVSLQTVKNQMNKAISILKKLLAPYLN